MRPMATFSAHWAHCKNTGIVMPDAKAYERIYLPDVGHLRKRTEYHLLEFHAERVATAGREETDGFI